MAAVKLFVLLTRKDGLTTEQFRHHYETVHAPMAVRLFPMVKDYRRNFIDRDQVTLKPGASKPDFDVITELHFASEADYAAFLKRRSDPEIDAEVSADEDRLFNRSLNRRLVVTEKVSELPL
jgi:hypothetical protein